MNIATDFNRVFSFVESFDQKFREQLDRRSSGSVSPSAIVSFNVRKIRREQDLLLLGIASWWLGPTGFLLREDLREHLKAMQSEENKIRLRLILSSKVASQEVIIQTFHERDLYGNQLPRLLILLRRLEIVLYRVKPAKRVQRHRGYRDHGTLRPSHSWTETRDFSFTEAQMEKEDKDQLDEDTFEFLRGFLE